MAAVTSLWLRMIKKLLLPHLRWEIFITHRPRALDVDVVVRRGIRAPLVQTSTYRQGSITNPVLTFEFQKELLDWAEFLAQQELTWDEIQTCLSALQESD